MGEGDEYVGEDDDGVGVDCGDDDGPNGVPAPPGEGGEPPLLLLPWPPPIWEESSPQVHGLHGGGGA